ncbi:hypothetical protein GQ42DRAFT_4994 [Ramicandelaber brevisporus]|nr:hypothetical protein GQ42DRAFT_4994 [Ramicandelaber brevisporus]
MSTKYTMQISVCSSGCFALHKQKKSKRANMGLLQIFELYKIFITFWHFLTLLLIYDSKGRVFVSVPFRHVTGIVTYTQHLRSMEGKRIKLITVRHELLTRPNIICLLKQRGKTWKA